MDLTVSGRHGDTGLERGLKRGCVFCENILTHRAGYFVYENEFLAIFLDHAPVELGHLLIIPKVHFENIFDIDQEYYLKICEAARRIAPVLLKATDADGLNISQNNGACANQRIMHYHLHMIPRFCSDRISWERKEFSQDEMKGISTRIRESIERKRPNEP